MKGNNLDIAHAIARRICRDAVHHDGVCTWVAGSTLGGDLYGGTAGIGLVLTEISAFTDDREIRATALSTLRHALAAAHALPMQRDLGLFTGRLGIGLAVLRAANVAAREELVEQAGRLLATLPRPGAGRSGRPDLLGGAAGAVIGLLMADEALDAPGLRGEAIRIGEHLLASARGEAGALSWPGFAGVPARAGLTGLSHGVAGIAHALSELAAATGDERFLAGARGGYAYERGLVDAAGNWPDLRDLGSGGGYAVRSRLAWCHGAPGIALARHGAWLRTRDPLVREEVRTGVRLTARWLRAAVNTDRGRFCLCHGLAGNAEILLECARHAEGSAARDAVAAVADLSERYASGGGAWPCTGPWEEDPSLMTGLAGIARFHLRLHEPRIPTVLLPAPDRGWIPGGPSGLRDVSQRLPGVDEAPASVV